MLLYTKLSLMEYADAVSKFFQVSYRIQVRFLTITHSDHFGVDGALDKLSLKQDWHLFQKKNPPMVPVSINVKMIRC